MDEATFMLCMFAVLVIGLVIFIIVDFKTSNDYYRKTCQLLETRPEREDVRQRAANAIANELARIKQQADAQQAQHLKELASSVKEAAEPGPKERRYI